MSSAHRPTWDPAQGKDTRLNTRQYSSRDIASHTKLKFRQPGQGGQEEVARRDLKRDLELAEEEAQAKKRKGPGGHARIEEPKRVAITNGEVDDNGAKRRKILEEAVDLDKDDSDSDEDEAGASSKQDKGKGKAVESVAGDADDDSDDDSDEEDEMAELLKEMEKIKRERAEDKERQDLERAAQDNVSREESIATGNPLLNLQAAFANGPSTPVSTMSTSFQVKRRWDDDVIFKNQARGTTETPKRQFVNDLLRTEFHRKFLKRYIA